jgi:hypothetical protein
MAWPCQLSTRLLDSFDEQPSILMKTPPCDDVLILKEKMVALEAWRHSTEADLKEIRDVISQVKLLITLSI